MSYTWIFVWKLWYNRWYLILSENFSYISNYIHGVPQEIISKLIFEFEATVGCLAKFWVNGTCKTCSQWIRSHKTWGCPTSMEVTPRNISPLLKNSNMSLKIIFWGCPVIYTNIVTQDKLLQGGKDYMIRIEHSFRLTICGCTR